MVQAARHKARHDFRRDMSLEPASTAAVKAIEHAEGVAQTLRENVVQGQAVSGEEGTYKLNIHEHTERGENDTVKNPRGKGGKVKVDTGSF